MSALPTDDRPDYAEQLRAHRRRQGLSQAQLAARLGTTPQTVGRWEAGSSPQIRWISKLESELSARGSASVVRSLTPPRATRARMDRGIDPLTDLEERVITSFLRRAGGGMMSDAELDAFRAVFRRVGIQWDDD